MVSFVYLLCLQFDTILTYMKDLLERMKLTDHLTTELQISAQEFVEKLSANVDPVHIGLFPSNFEAFSSSKNEFKGKVDYSGFKIKIRHRLFERYNHALATGSIIEQNGRLLIETAIEAADGMIISIFFIIIFCVSITIIIVAASPNSSGGDGVEILIPIVFIILMLVIGYFLLRRDVSRLKYELDREFHYLASKPIHP